MRTAIRGKMRLTPAPLVYDPLDLKDASNIKRIALVNERFDGLIMSRLNTLSRIASMTMICPPKPNHSPSTSMAAGSLP